MVYLAPLAFTFGFWPGYQYETEADLQAGRALEYVLLEQTALALVAMVFAGMALWSLVASLVHIVRVRGTREPLLLLGLREYAWILAIGVGLPLLVYCAYAQWDWLSGRDVAVRYQFGRFVLEMTVLGTGICLVSMATGLTLLRRRCRRSPAAAAGRQRRDGAAGRRR